MRITTGKFKNRKIYMPRGIRPTQDKVRKAVFDILGCIEGLSFLELFAGSGAMAIEAISRGAKGVVMAEFNRDCVLAIKRNLEALNIRECEIYPMEAEKALRFLHKNGRSFDLIFLDPPYIKTLFPRFQKTSQAGNSGLAREEEVPSLAKKTLQLLGGYDILTAHGLVIAQHFKRDELSGTIGELKLVKEAFYGDTVLSIYKKGD